MILDLVKSLLLRRLRSFPRLFFLLVLGAQDLVQVVLSGTAGPATAGMAGMGTLILGSGLLGQERGDGSLSLLCTRPLSRARILMHAYLAAVVGGAGYWAVQTALRLSVAVLPTVDITPSPGTWVVETCTALNLAIGLGAVVTFFGAVFRGLSGLAAHAVLLYAAVTLHGYARDSGNPLVYRAAKELQGFFLNFTDFETLLAPGEWSWCVFLTPLSNASLALLAACWFLGRMPLSYSSGD